MKISDYRLIVFESGLRENYYPLSLTKPTFDLTLGTNSLLEFLESRFQSKSSGLFVPSYLEKLAAKEHGDIVNKHVPNKSILINSLISQDQSIWRLIDEYGTDQRNRWFLDSEKNPVFGIMDEALPEQLSKKVMQRAKKKPLPVEAGKTALMKYPWNLVQENGNAITSAFQQGMETGGLQGDFETRGNKFRISPQAEIGRYVTLDSRGGPIIVEDDVEIQTFSHLSGPCFVGKGSKIRSAKIRGNTTIGRDCRVSGEVEESIVSDFTNKNHDGFIGHSYIGSWVNLGALTTNSDLKNTYGNVKVSVKNRVVDTGANKVGIFVADMVKTAIGTLITSGRKLGVASHVFGFVAKDVPSFTIFAGSLGTRNTEQYINSAVETQNRMMKRRGVQMTEEYIAMMKQVFKATQGERTSSKTGKGRFKL